jgi:oxygen-independent coproporphyrinogen-3 oxidase
MPASARNRTARAAAQFAAPAASVEAFGVYVHWPFCVSKCPYCDFNSHVREGIDQTRWRDALLLELDHAAREVPDRTVTSIFFGGGTPSLMPPDTVGAVIERVRTLWPAAPDIEITLEANPSSVEVDRFAALRDAGVNRLSLGVQALDDAALKFLGRAHDQREALRAIEIARKHFERTSFDLIYGRPGHTVAAWRGELMRALELVGDHLSLYQLTIERGTRFFTEHARGAFVLPDEDTQAALYETTQDLLGAAGLPAYEISNHARPGSESRHNLVYWRYQDYVGVGPGAHGRFARHNESGKTATRRHSGPEAWLDAVAHYGHGTAETHAVDRAQMVREALLMGLRLTEGIARQRFAGIVGADLLEVIDAGKLAPLIEGGLLELGDTHLRATAHGRQVLNAVLARLVG